MRVLKVVPMLLLAVMLTSASGVRARTLHGVVLSADDNGNCKDKGLHKGNDKGRCGPSPACLAACDAAAADGTASCLATFDPNLCAGDPACIVDIQTQQDQCVADVEANHLQCVAACSQ